MVRRCQFGVFKRGLAPLSFSSPSPFKERGIKGVRLISNLKLALLTAYGVQGYISSVRTSNPLTGQGFKANPSSVGKLPAALLSRFINKIKIEDR